MVSINVESNPFLTFFSSEREKDSYSRSIPDELDDAAKKGNLSRIRELLPFCDPRSNDHRAIIHAASEGHIDCVRELLPLSRDIKDNSKALRLAACDGHHECVELLIPVSDPREEDSRALRWAARYGHTRCVELLIPVSNPNADDVQALYWAAKFKHVECLRLLTHVCHVPTVIDRLKNERDRATISLIESVSLEESFSSSTRDKSYKFRQSV